MKIEDISFYTINKSLQMSNDKYLLDFNKLLYILLLIENEYIKNYETQLFDETFIFGNKELYIGIQNNFHFDISATEYLKNKLFIFIDIFSDYYTHPTFNVEIDISIKLLIDKVVEEYGLLTKNQLKELIIDKYKLHEQYGYKAIPKEGIAKKLTRA